MFRLILGYENAAFSLFGFYMFNKALSNTDGIGTFPANPYNFSGEYGPAATDIRHRVTLGGSITTRWNIRLSPYFIVQSGMPFDITSGNDPYGTTLLNHNNPGPITGDITSPLFGRANQIAGTPNGEGFGKLRIIADSNCKSA